MFRSLIKIFKILDKKEKYFFYFLVFLSILVMFLEVIGLSLIIPIISLILSDDIINKFPDLFEKISFFIEIEKNKLLQLFSNYLHMPYHKLFERSSGTLTSNINIVVPSISSFILNFLTFITEIVIIIGLITFFLIKQPVSTLILCLVFGSCAIIYYVFFKKKFKLWGHKRFTNSAFSNKILLQAFSAKKDLRGNDLQKYFLDKYNKSNFTTIVNIYLIRLFSSTPKLFLESLGVFVLGLLVQ